MAFLALVPLLMVVGIALDIVALVMAIVALVRYDDERTRWDKPEPQREVAKAWTVRRGR